MLNKIDYLKTNLRRITVFLVILGGTLAAQGITVPDTPSQAPIGGLGYLAILGGAMAYNKLRNKK
tara:strand:- start:75 stop:269 length:195 start_codon:yes stop_codon:yes gene_type:complete